MNPIKRTSHAVYDLKYHMVWIPKYRKMILKGDLARRLKVVFEEIAERHEFEIDTMRGKISLSFPFAEGGKRGI